MRDPVKNDRAQQRLAQHRKAQRAYRAGEIPGRAPRVTHEQDVETADAAQRAEAQLWRRLKEDPAGELHRIEELSESATAKPSVRLAARRVLRRLREERRRAVEDALAAD